MLRNTSDTLATSLLSFGKTLMRVRIPFFVIQKTKNSINNGYKVKNKTLKVLFIIKKVIPTLKKVVPNISKG
ncbi:hypothetical protein ACI76W_04700 [Capnocytophaga canimorsus]|uniref:hypothetical protein n=1 Tax=Capnocytophaga canimorsus TaxID=28188 RepID=UPI003858DFE5